MSGIFYFSNMQEATPKERMLKKIRKALIEKAENPFPKFEDTEAIFASSPELLEIQFAEAFNKVNGQFVYCEDEKDFLLQLKSIAQDKKWTNIFCWEKELQGLIKNQIAYQTTDFEFITAVVGITTCEALVARTGSILISSGSAAGRRLSIYPSIHVVVAYTSQLKNDTIDAIQFMNEKYQGQLPSLMSVVAGPSRTADIEKTLVLGAHGPRELFLFLIDDTQA